MFSNINLVISTMRSGWRDLLALDCELRSGLQAHSAACSVRDDRRVVRRTPLRASNSTKASRKHKLPEAFYYSEFVVYHRITSLLLTFTLHAVFVVVVDYGLEHYVALDIITS